MLSLDLSLGLGIAGAAGGFNPLSIPGSLVSYDPATASQSGGFVSAVPDGSGNGRNAVITGGQAPALIAADAAYNGRPTFSFPNTDTKRIGYPNLGLTTGPFTIVMVGDAQGANAYMCSVDIAGGQAQLLRIGAPVSFAASYLPSASVINDGTITAKNVIVAIGNGASSRLYASNKTGVTGDAGTHNLTGALGILGNYGPSIDPAFSMFGKIAYFGVWNGVMSPANVNAMLDGLGALFGVTIGP